MTTKHLKKQGSSTRTGLIIGIVGAVVLLALIAVVLTGTDEIGAEYGDPTVSGQPLTSMPQSTSIDTSANGMTIPAVTGQDFDGNEVVIDPTDGRAKAIVFLAHWCSFCQEEVPAVQTYIDATGGDPDVDLYSVATSIDSTRANYPPSDWLNREGWTVPVIRDNRDNDALMAYGAGAFPYWVFTMSDGTVAGRTSGRLQPGQLEEILAELE
jgi:hypothetical protein